MHISYIHMYIFIWVLQNKYIYYIFERITVVFMLAGVKINI